MKKLLEQTPFQVLLFGICLVLFDWPFLTIIPIERQEILYVYLFTAWAIVIFILFQMSRLDV
ncbi:MAG TPA: hypothetical protein V6C82_02275 [Chroococcales cyanobacterium]|jgi:hypothetical protein